MSNLNFALSTKTMTNAISDKFKIDVFNALFSVSNHDGFPLDTTDAVREFSTRIMEGVFEERVMEITFNNNAKDDPNYSWKLKYERAMKIAERLLERYNDDAFKDVYKYAKEDIPAMFPELKEDENAPF